MDAGIFDLWAKTGPNEKWLSLPYHLLDVGACAEALWEYLPSRSKQVAFDVLGEKAPATVAFLAASHDVGKANRFFQSKSAPRRSAMAWMKPAQDEPCRHGQATGVFLSKWLRDRWRRPKSWALPIALAVGGHHGTFYNDATAQLLEVDGEPWSRFGNDLIDLLNRIYDPRPPEGDDGRFGEFLGWLAGFVSVADWLGSHQRMQTWKTQGNEESAVAHSREAKSRAREALVDLGWVRPRTESIQRIEDLLGEGRLPNPLQLAAESIGSDWDFAIIEAPTGEGKTEAAFQLASPFLAQGDGLYLAMPTVATANGIYPRVERFLGEQDVRLLHGRAAHGAFVAAPSAGDEDPVAPAEDWFAGRNRGLLTPYGAGTIDQALLAALAVKHGFVRLFALAGKVIIFDEIHAYDFYMAALICRLLEWLKALGCRVILLSATLPNERKRNLLRAWGVNGEDPCPYPSIAWTSSGDLAKSCTFSVRSRKPLTFQLFETEDIVDLAIDHAYQKVRDGEGYGAVVFNTVAHAQRAFEVLRERLGDKVMLFHARYVFEDRERIEKDVLSRFGKEALREGSLLLVATQVIEQSLDLDFDFMISELAPIDLLIQRAGRLHRHNRTSGGVLSSPGEPDSRPNPEFLVLAPQEDRSLIYYNSILRKTRLLLRVGLTLADPEDVSKAVESVYSDAQFEDEDVWRMRAEEEESDEQKALRARFVEILSPKSEDPITSNSYTLTDDEDPESKLRGLTRLELAPSYALVVTQFGESPERMSRDALERRIVNFQDFQRLAKNLEKLRTHVAMSGPLKYALHVPLDEQGEHVANKARFLYDEKLGLRVEKNAEF